MPKKSRSNTDVIFINEDEFNGPFSLPLTMSCEQSPTDAWFPRGDGYYTHFMLNDRWVRPFVVQKPHGLEVNVIDERVSDSELKRVKNLILHQLWLEYDLHDFYRKFSPDRYMGRLIRTYRGLRVMRNWDLFWSFIEGICTQNASVKQIRHMDRSLRVNFGEKITFPDGEIFHTFPGPEVLAGLTAKELQEGGRVGYRAEYIINAAKLILNGNLDLTELKDIPTGEAREILKTQVKGIGNKVADIILLYGLGKPDAFPMDRWIRRALVREYSKGKRVADRKLRDFALEYFGEHAGVAHLYTFTHERKKLGK